MHLSPTLRPSSSYHRHHRHHHPRPQHLLLVALLNIGFLATTAAAFTAKPSAAVEDTEEDLSAVPEWVYLLEAYGIDLTAMLLIAWTVLVAMLVLGVVLWNKLTQSHQPPKQDNRRNNEAKVSKESAVDNMSSLPPSAALKSSSAQPPLTSSTDSASIVGKDRDTIAWLQRVIEWMGKLSTSSGHTTTTTTTNDIIDTWLAALNAKSKKLTLEVSCNKYNLGGERETDLGNSLAAVEMQMLAGQRSKRKGIIKVSKKIPEQCTREVSEEGR